MERNAERLERALEEAKEEAKEAERPEAKEAGRPEAKEKAGRPSSRDGETLDGETFDEGGGEIAAGSKSLSANSASLSANSVLVSGSFDVGTLVSASAAAASAGLDLDAPWLTRRERRLLETERVDAARRLDAAVADARRDAEASVASALASAREEAAAALRRAEEAEEDAAAAGRGPGSRGGSEGLRCARLERDDARVELDALANDHEILLEVLGEKTEALERAEAAAAAAETAAEAAAASRTEHPGAASRGVGDPGTGAAGVARGFAGAARENHAAFRASLERASNTIGTVEAVGAATPRAFASRDVLEPVDAW